MKSTENSRKAFAFKIKMDPLDLGGPYPLLPSLNKDVIPKITCSTEKATRESLRCYHHVVEQLSQRLQSPTSDWFTCEKKNPCLFNPC